LIAVVAVAPVVRAMGVAPGVCDQLRGPARKVIVLPVVVTAVDAGPRLSHVVPLSGDHCNCAVSVGVVPETVPHSTVT
jgi:hypothetical protein